MATPVRVTAKQIFKDLYKCPAGYSMKSGITIFDHINSKIDFVSEAYFNHCPRRILPTDAEKDLINKTAHKIIFRFLIESLIVKFLSSPNITLLTIDSIIRQQDEMFEFKDCFEYDYQIKFLYKNLIDRLDKFYTDCDNALFFMDSTIMSPRIEIINCFIDRLRTALKL